MEEIPLVVPIKKVFWKVKEKIWSLKPDGKTENMDTPGCVYMDGARKRMIYMGLAKMYVSKKFEKK